MLHWTRKDQCVCVCFWMRVPMYVSVCEWRHVGGGAKAVQLHSTLTGWRVLQQRGIATIDPVVCSLLSLLDSFRPPGGVWDFGGGQQLQWSRDRSDEGKILQSPAVGLTGRMLDLCRSRKSTRRLAAKCDLSKCTERKFEGKKRNVLNSEPQSRVTMK